MKLMQDYMATKEAKDKIKLLTINSNTVSDQNIVETLACDI